MEHIFISYSNKDKAFSQRLVNDLERFYQIWIDKEQLSGGLEWEQMIDKALTECRVFAVIVSENSNNSEWVARETIRAEQLSKYRIPILIDGNLPLRLLNVHYVDFRGEYEGGFRDLLEVLKEQIEPEDRKQGDANRLIGEGVRAHLIRDYSKANSLIGQALILDARIANSIEEFWSKLRYEHETNWADELISHIEIRERAKLFKENIHSDQAGHVVNMYRWSVEIAVSDKILEKIDYVKYQLHETFPEPIQIVRARDNNFRIGGQAWGLFDIYVTIYFKDSTMANGVHSLNFENRLVPLSLR
jgi:hypothetical protein